MLASYSKGHVSDVCADCEAMHDPGPNSPKRWVACLDKFHPQLVASAFSQGMAGIGWLRMKGTGAFLWQKCCSVT